MKRAIAVGGLAALVTVGCAPGAIETPPLETDELTQTVKLSDLWVGSSLLGAVKVKLPVPELPSLGGLFSLPYLKVPLGTDAGAAISVPERARNAPISKATLVLTTTNLMAIPLTLRIFLAREKPYANDGNPGLLAMSAAGEAGETATTEKTLDTSLFSGAEVRLGIGVSSSGSAGAAVSVSTDDAVTARAKVVFRLKIL
jgi:hypothetical protein